eukprot:SAG11_NODE_18922_length_478_cov_0.841689_2_plen_24_part_01
MRALNGLGLLRAGQGNYEPGDAYS